MQVQQRTNSQPAFTARNVMILQSAEKICEKTFKVVNDAVPELKKIGDKKISLEFDLQKDVLQLGVKKRLGAAPTLLNKLLLKIRPKSTMFYNFSTGNELAEVTVLPPKTSFGRLLQRLLPKPLESMTMIETRPYEKATTKQEIINFANEIFETIKNVD